jgi:hypothetical protein
MGFTTSQVNRVGTEPLLTAALSTEPQQPLAPAVELPPVNTAPAASPYQSSNGILTAEQALTFVNEVLNWSILKAQIQIGRASCRERVS